VSFPAGSASAFHGSGASPSASSTAERGSPLGPYLAVCAVVGLGLAVQTLRQLWSSDVWQHAATVEAFGADPLGPNHPLTVGLASDPYLLNLWGLGWGTVARVTGLSTFTVLQGAALANAVFVAVALYRLVRTLDARAWSPALALASMLLLWGPSTWRWSGYPSLNAIGFGLPYPSYTAFALFLFGITTALRLRHTRARTGPPWGLAIICAGATLCHPSTGAALCASVVVVALVSPIDRWSLTRDTVLAVAIAGLIVLLWPFGHAWELLGAPEAFDAINRPVNENLLRSAGLALVAAPWVLWRLGGEHASAVRAVVVLNLTISAIGFLGGPSVAGRCLPFALVLIQVAFAIAIAEYASDRRHRWAAAAALGVVAAIGTYGARGALPRLIPSQLLPARIADDDRLVRTSTVAADVPDVPIDEPVALAVGASSRHLVAAGVRVVVPPYPVAALDDGERERRQRDTAAFLSASPADQQEILDRYDIDIVVVASGTADVPGEPIASSGTMDVYDVRGLRR
jgi:hypothetical protein